jgi:CBS domain-containing protein
MKRVGALVEGQQLVVVAHDQTVAEAARRMAERHVGAVPVVDGTRVVGVFSERDLLARVVAAGRDPARTRVREVMTTDLVVAAPADTYEECLRRMQRAGIRHLLVLAEGRLIGIVSLRDLMSVDLDEKAEAITLLNAYVHDIPVVLGPRR